MSGETICTGCGATIDANHRFCPSCGRAKDATPDAAANEMARLSNPAGGPATTPLGGSSPATPPSPQAMTPYNPQGAPVVPPYMPGPQPLAPYAPAPPVGPQAAAPYPPVPYNQPTYDVQTSPNMHASPNIQASPNMHASPVFAPTMVQHVNVIQQAAPATTVIVAHQGPGCLVRAIYFLLVGWWLAGFWIGLAWLCIISLILLPIGLIMLNRVPQVMTLSPGSSNLTVRQVGNTTIITHGEAAQYPLLARAIYFLVIGWWASLFWITLAYLGALTIIGLPISFMMFNVIGFVTTLRRN